MREKLAVARSRSDMTICAASAFGDQLGGLILRGIDNQDRKALLEAKYYLANRASKQFKTSILSCNKAAHRVLQYLDNSRCAVCEGHKYLTHETTGVSKPCTTFDATGFTGDRPNRWESLHEEIFHEALKSIGAHLNTFRQNYKEIIDEK